MSKPRLMKTGRRPPVDLQKLDTIVEVLPASPAERLEMLLIFDARALDKETRQELLRLLPEIARVRRAWKAEFMECGCLCCHRKRVAYGAGGFCNACAARVLQRMRNRYKKAMKGFDAEVEAFRDALALKYNAAQRLFGSQD